MYKDYTKNGLENTREHGENTQQAIAKRLSWQANTTRVHDC